MKASPIEKCVFDNALAGTFAGVIKGNHHLSRHIQNAGQSPAVLKLLRDKFGEQSVKISPIKII